MEKTKMLILLLVVGFIWNVASVITLSFVNMLLSWAFIACLIWIVNIDAKKTKCK